MPPLFENTGKDLIALEKKPYIMDGVSEKFLSETQILKEKSEAGDKGKCAGFLPDLSISDKKDKADWKDDDTIRMKKEKGEDGEDDKKGMQKDKADFTDDDKKPVKTEKENWGKEAIGLKGSVHLEL